MRVVIQCAARKQPGAGSFIAVDGRKVLFVAHPGLAPPEAGLVHARPDDASEDGRSWRQRLVAYNAVPDGNALELLPAWRLYRHDAYGALVERFGPELVFILSAGWGLIPSTMLTPLYDITFSSQAKPWMRRRKQDRYEDFAPMPNDGEDILFLGGRDYLPLFCALTASLLGRKIVMVRGARVPGLPAGFAALRYDTATRTNWHYEAARNLAAGSLATLSL